MSYPSETILKMMHRDSFNNREMLKRDGCGSCFSCLGYYKFELFNWCTEASGKQTGLCPDCGIDSVIPGRISISTLEKMRKKFFNGCD
jgi:hypothetical protein